MKKTKTTQTRKKKYNRQIKKIKSQKNVGGGEAPPDIFHIGMEQFVERKYNQMEIDKEYALRHFDINDCYRMGILSQLVYMDGKQEDDRNILQKQVISSFSDRGETLLHNDDFIDRFCELVHLDTLNIPSDELLRTMIYKYTGLRLFSAIGNDYNDKYEISNRDPPRLPETIEESQIVLQKRVRYAVAIDELPDKYKIYISFRGSIRPGNDGSMDDWMSNLNAVKKNEPLVCFRYDNNKCNRDICFIENGRGAYNCERQIFYGCKYEDERSKCVLENTIPENKYEFMNYTLNCNIHSGFFGKYTDYRMRLVNDLFSQLTEIYIIENEKQQKNILVEDIIDSLKTLFTMNNVESLRIQNGNTNSIEKIDINALETYLRASGEPQHKIENMLNVYKLLENKSVEIIVGGHSLGGALSSLASLDINYLFSNFCKNLLVINYTFGCPNVLGDLNFGEIYRDEIPDNFHFVNREDLVSFISSPMSKLNSHGFRVMMGSSDINQQRNCECAKSLNDHKMYLYYLACILRNEFDFSFFNVNSNVVLRHTETNDFDNKLLSVIINNE